MPKTIEKITVPATCGSLSLLTVSKFMHAQLNKDSLKYGVKDGDDEQVLFKAKRVNNKFVIKSFKAKVGDTFTQKKLDGIREFTAYILRSMQGSFSEVVNEFTFILTPHEDNGSYCLLREILYRYSLNAEESVLETLHVKLPMDSSAVCYKKVSLIDANHVSKNPQIQVTATLSFEGLSAACQQPIKNETVRVPISDILGALNWTMFASVYSRRISEHEPVMTVDWKGVSALMHYLPKAVSSHCNIMLDGNGYLRIFELNAQPKVGVDDLHNTVASLNNFLFKFRKYFAGEVSQKAECYLVPESQQGTSIEPAPALYKLHSLQDKKEQNFYLYSDHPLFLHNANLLGYLENEPTNEQKAIAKLTVLSNKFVGNFRLARLIDQSLKIKPASAGNHIPKIAELLQHLRNIDDARPLVATSTLKALMLLNPECAYAVRTYEVNDWLKLLNSLKDKFMSDVASRHRTFLSATEGCKQKLEINVQCVNAMDTLDSYIVRNAFFISLIGFLQLSGIGRADPQALFDALPDVVFPFGYQKNMKVTMEFLKAELHHLKELSVQAQRELEQALDSDTSEGDQHLYRALVRQFSVQEVVGILECVERLNRSALSIKKGHSTSLQKTTVDSSTTRAGQLTGVIEETDSGESLSETKSQSNTTEEPDLGALLAEHKNFVKQHAFDDSGSSIRKSRRKKKVDTVKSESSVAERARALRANVELEILKSKSWREDADNWLEKNRESIKGTVSQGEQKVPQSEVITSSNAVTGNDRVADELKEADGEQAQSKALNAQAEKTTTSGSEKTTVQNGGAAVTKKKIPLRRISQEKLVMLQSENASEIPSDRRDRSGALLEASSDRRGRTNAFLGPLPSIEEENMKSGHRMLYRTKEIVRPMLISSSEDSPKVESAVKGSVEVDEAIQRERTSTFEQIFSDEWAVKYRSSRRHGKGDKDASASSISKKEEISVNESILDEGVVLRSKRGRGRVLEIKPQTSNT